MTRFWLPFLLNRLLRLAILLPLVAAASFTLLALSPIDPVRAYVGDRYTLVGPEQQAAIAAKWGLDQPPLDRFVRWASNIAQGDLGQSLIHHQPVAEVLRDRFLASLALMVGAWILAGILGFALGMLAGAVEGSWIDRLIRAYAFTLASAPTFWAAILLLVVFAVELNWAPVCCAVPPGLLPDQITLADRLAHLVLPTITLSLIGVAQITLHTRDKLRDVMRSDYATLSFARGMGRLQVAWRHGRRNAVLPALTLHFAHWGEIFGGSVLAETVFAYPGLGQATVQAGLRGDAPLLLGIALFAALFVFIGNSLADLLHRLIDPRLREGAP